MESGFFGSIKNNADFFGALKNNIIFYKLLLIIYIFISPWYSSLGCFHPA
ncbi:hypothetical protein CRENPOLYSF1_670039 [Crenothrix polyspora]|uniref:Uncharacterized protein n=1 Tax=Crenothrix polyspora TaxID=360316 RepID=A0A1R4HGE2_9GAMM|nr:hypothetical protein CRENPOLYSF1_670039 [Crenothrix polyspora]